MRLIGVVGPTASRKSELALALAERLGGELVCCDSVQVYRGFRLGSAAPTAAERAQAPHHAYEVFEPSDPGDAARYAALADEAIADITARGRLPIVVGGTGLYLRALLDGLAPVPAVSPEVRVALAKELAQAGSEPLFARLQALDPALAARIQGGARNTQRVLRGLEVVVGTGQRLSDLQLAQVRAGPRYDTTLLAPRFPAEVLARRIDARVEAMLTAGLAEEVRDLLAGGAPRDCRPMRALGYRQMADYVMGDCTLEAAVSAMKQGHRHYARRQRTWFQSVKDVVWLDGTTAALIDEAMATVSGSR